MLGVYGVTAFEVSRRTREVGVRIALGARTLDVLRWIFAQGAVPLLAGVVIGVVAAGALTRILSALLYGVEATDLPTFMTVPLALTAMGLLAIYLPARRAASVDPNVALQSD